MKVNSFLELNIQEVLNGLDGETKDFVLELWKLFKQIDFKKISPSASFNIDSNKNLCIIKLISQYNDNIDLNIDVFNGYFDFFISDEEVLIQRKILPIEKSIDLIYNYLRYEVEEIIYERIGDKKVKKQINFYKNSKKVGGIGSVLILPFLFNGKQRKVTKYNPWIK